MGDKISFFCQDEYTRVLDAHGARRQGLSQGNCERILIDAGADYGQAKNGAYVYLNHYKHQKMSERACQEDYDQIMDDFNARIRKPQDCIKHLESLGYSYGQAKSAVYKYRVNRGLIKKG